MLVLAMGYIGCVVLFTHVHVINGTIIVHAHKATDTDGEQHRHTSNDLILFHALSHYAVSDLDVPQYIFKEWFYSFYFWNTNISLSFPSHYYYHCQFRAPPPFLL